jgi:Flp pilus assembly protein TadD
MALNQGHPAQAQRFYQKAIEQNPKQATAHYGLGLSLEAQGKLDEARAAFEQFVRLTGGEFPEDPAVYLKLKKFGVI